LRKCPVESAGGAFVHVLPSSDVWMLDEAGSVSVHWTAMPEIFVRAPRSTVRLPPPADSTGHFRNPVQARYVRVNMTVASGADRTAIREVVVTKST